MVLNILKVESKYVLGAYIGGAYKMRFRVSRYIAVWWRATGFKPQMVIIEPTQ